MEPGEPRQTAIRRLAEVQSLLHLLVFVLYRGPPGMNCMTRSDPVETATAPTSEDLSGVRPQFLGCHSRPCVIHPSSLAGIRYFPCFGLLMVEPVRIELTSEIKLHHLLHAYLMRGPGPLVCTLFMVTACCSNNPRKS